MGVSLCFYNQIPRAEAELIGQIQPRARFYKYSFIGTQPSLLIHIFSTAAFTPQWWSWIIITDHIAHEAWNTDCLALSRKNLLIPNLEYCLCHSRCSINIWWMNEPFSLLVSQKGKDPSLEYRGVDRGYGHGQIWPWILVLPSKSGATSGNLFGFSAFHVPHL